MGGEGKAKNNKKVKESKQRNIRKKSKCWGEGGGKKKKKL